MKTMNVVRKYGSKIAVATGALAASAGAFADAAAVGLQLEGVEGNIDTIGWAVLGVLVVAAGFKYMRRAI
ncbi:major capsid protein [Pseudomonas abyssi]|uniref:major capsid protein n=1 Tax=Pseudomonas abyssi TaxID=170540 RepID=UPI003C7A923A